MNLKKIPVQKFQPILFARIYVSATFLRLLPLIVLHARPLSTPFYSVPQAGWLITCSMFNFTVPHFQDSKQKCNCKLLTMKSCTCIIQLPNKDLRTSTGSDHRTTSSPADRTIARWPVSPAVLPQATSRENYRTCTFRNFLPNQLPCGASLRIADKRKSRSSHDIWCLTCNFNAYKPFSHFK